MSVNLIPQALCSVEDIRTQRDFSSEELGRENDYYTILINAFSRAAERYCGREFEIKERTELFDGGIIGSRGGPTTMVFAAAPPIDVAATLSIWDDPTLAFGNSSLLTLNQDYAVNHKLGIISKITLQMYDAGFTYPLHQYSSPNRLLFDLNRSHFGAGFQMIRMTYTGGLVLPRPAGPAVPTVAASGDTGITGSYGYAETTVDANGNESLPSDTALITVVDQGVTLTLHDPGPGCTARLYRSLAGAGQQYKLTSIAGVTLGGTLSYTDAAVDDALDSTISPPLSGPLSVPDDLRLAAMQQITHWIALRKDGEVQQYKMAQGDVVFSRRHDDTWISSVQQILNTYRRAA